jgi:hypothetical protein
LHDDPIAQAVEQQGLLGFGQAELPGPPGVLDGRQGRGSGTSVMSRDEHHISLRLGHTGGYGTDPHLGNQLDVHSSGGVGALQVMNQLLEVFDRVDVVMRGRADQPYAGRRVTSTGYPGIHLGSG